MNLFEISQAVVDAVCNGIMFPLGIGFGAGIFWFLGAFLGNVLRRETPKAEVTETGGIIINEKLV